MEEQAASGGAEEEGDEPRLRIAKGMGNFLFSYEGNKNAVSRWKSWTSRICPRMPLKIR
jgi:hypothetical protein